jgi:hypothetical protein
VQKLLTRAQRLVSRRLLRQMLLVQAKVQVQL